jgi:hypothetical protein
MSFKIIDGGNDKTPKENIEQLKVFVSHMRALENSISSIKTLASDMKWNELNLKLTSCHDQILDTLAYVKNSTKSKITEVNAASKKPKSHLKLL